jgi:hypothetical protein
VSPERRWRTNLLINKTKNLLATSYRLRDSGITACWNDQNLRHRKAELQRCCMRAFNWLLTLLFLVGCNETTQPHNVPQKPSKAPTEAPVERLKEDHVAADFANFLAPLIDPAKLDTLKGKRAATPRLRKACYWLQMAHTSGFDAGENRPSTRSDRPTRA